MCAELHVLCEYLVHSSLGGCRYMGVSRTEELLSQSVYHEQVLGSSCKACQSEKYAKGVCACVNSRERRVRGR